MQSSPVFFLSIVAVLGLIIGSFLNVVIHRLPVMMHNSWRQQCHDFIGSDNKQQDKEPQQANATYNLMVPRSACPHCGHAITALENIPVLSYLFLKGKCSECGKAISIRYPIVEAVTALMSVAVAWHFGFGWATAAGLLLTWAFIALSMIDFDHQLLPDSITLPFLWFGLFIAMFGVFTDLRSSVIGAIAGYLTLWSVYWAFKLITKKEGMGYGDFKLLAMIGAWFGWKAIPTTILLSSFVGAVVGLALIAFKGRDKNIPIPFGPYIAAAGWISMLWGDQLITFYLRFAGLN